MSSGVHKGSSNTTIKPQSYEFFTFHNSFLTGLSGELFLDHEKKHFRVGFSNPLVGACKGLIDGRDAGHPFDYKEKDALRRADNSEK